MLFCWKMKLYPSLCNISSKITPYLAPSTLPSPLTSFPVSAEESHPHIMMLPPPCVTAMILCSGQSALLVFKLLLTFTDLSVLVTAMSCWLFTCVMFFPLSVDG
ncbi:hypothetical protein XENOCAPTIV_027139 [Xenoophorus captivus]|uniref:Uncharacterized protein n=1 Tax=Xenoophorus captivus TaxID=1517983 RepID=A0ABV0RBU7_9TELE